MSFRDFQKRVNSLPHSNKPQKEKKKEKTVKPDYVYTYETPLFSDSLSTTSAFINISNLMIWGNSRYVIR